MFLSVFTNISWCEYLYNNPSTLDDPRSWPNNWFWTKTLILYSHVWPVWGSNRSHVPFHTAIWKKTWTNSILLEPQRYMWSLDLHSLLQPRMMRYHQRLYRSTKLFPKNLVGTAIGIKFHQSICLWRNCIFSGKSVNPLFFAWNIHGFLRSSPNLHGVNPSNPKHPRYSQVVPPRYQLA